MKTFKNDTLRKTILPPPVTPSDEEPIAAGGRQICDDENRIEMNILPPLVTPSDEEPIATGGRCF